MSNIPISEQIVNARSHLSAHSHKTELSYLFGYKKRFSPLNNDYILLLKSVQRNFAIIQVLSFLINPKDLDPSYKMDLDFWDCFTRKQLCIIDFWDCFTRKQHCIITEEIQYAIKSDAKFLPLTPQLTPLKFFMYL